MHHDVLRLDVSVNDTQRVDLIDCVADLLHDEGDARLGQRLCLLELMVELSACAHLQNDVDIGGIVEAAVEFDDIGMIEKHLDLHLSDKLVSDLLFMQQFLLDHLQGTDEISVSLSYQVYTAVFTVS